MDDKFIYITNDDKQNYKIKLLVEKFETNQAKFIKRANEVVLKLWAPV